MKWRVRRSLARSRRSAERGPDDDRRRRAPSLRRSSRVSLAGPPVVDLFAGGEPDALFPAHVVEQRLERADTLRGPGDVGVKADTEHARLARTLGPQAIELGAQAVDPLARRPVLDHD